MNSQSRIAYSFFFAEAKERRVAIRGEVPLDVVKDEKRPFIVDIDNMEIIRKKYELATFH